MLQVDSLVFEHFSKKRSTPVLQGCSFTVSRGEFAALAGASGSGKTTLLHCLAGLLRPSSGRILLEGEELTTKKVEELSLLRRTKIGMAFQASHLLPMFTALENVMVPLLLGHAGRTGARTAAEEALEAVGLSHRAIHYPDELSSGEQARVGFARSIVHDPALLLADEPTGNLDEGTTLDLLALLDTFRRNRNLTILVATHDPVVARVCGRQLQMTAGKVKEP